MSKGQYWSEDGVVDIDGVQHLCYVQVEHSEYPIQIADGFNMVSWKDAPISARVVADGRALLHALGSGDAVEQSPDEHGRRRVAVYNGPARRGRPLLDHPAWNGYRQT